MSNNYYNFATPFVPGTRVLSDEVNTEYSGLEAAFDKLPIPAESIIRGTTYFGTESGSGNNYIITLLSPRTSYAEGDRVLFLSTHANTGSASANVDGLGAVTIVRHDGNTLVGGELANDSYFEMVYDSGNAQFMLLTPPADYLTDMDARVDWAEEWAVKAEDSLISVDAGGDGATDYSSLHWAAKSNASAIAALASETAAAISEAAAAASAAAAAASAAANNLPDPVGAAGQFLEVNAGATGYDNLDFRAENVSWSGNHTWLPAAGTVGNTIKPADASGDGAFNGLLLKHSDDTYRGFFGSIPSDPASYFTAYVWDTTLGTPAWNRVLGATADAKSIELSSTGAAFESGVSLSGDIQFTSSGYGFDDQWGNELFTFGHIASATNFMTMSNAATGNDPKIAANGTDANVGLDFAGKGTGFISLLGESEVTDKLHLRRTSSQLWIHESDLADPEDAFVLDANTNRFNLFTWDDSTSTAATKFRIEKDASLLLLDGSVVSYPGTLNIADIVMDGTFSNEGILIDDVGQKRISWNDGGGNFTIRGGAYADSGEKYVKGGDGASKITLNSDGTSGLVQMDVAGTGVSADDPVTYSDSMTLGVGVFTHNGDNIHTDGDETGWITATLLNSWVNYSGTYTPARYRKHANGNVTVTLMVKNGSAANAIMMTLPVGYRPSHTMISGAGLSAAGAANTRVDIGSNGNITFVVGGHTSWNSFCFTFAAA